MARSLELKGKKLQKKRNLCEGMGSETGKEDKEWDRKRGGRHMGEGC